MGEKLKFYYYGDGDPVLIDSIPELKLTQEDFERIEVPDLTKSLAMTVEIDLFGEKLTRKRIRFFRENLLVDLLAVRFPRKKNRRKKRRRRVVHRYTDLQK